MMYPRVFATFARNSLVRDMTFRWNFVIESLSSLSWMLMNLGFYVLIFRFTDEIGAGTGWGKYQFFVFLSTTMFINSVVQAFFMPNCRGVQRIGPHRRARFRHAQADRHAVLDLAAESRLVEFVELRLCRLPAGLFAAAARLPAERACRSCFIRAICCAGWR